MLHVGPPGPTGPPGGSPGLAPPQQQPPLPPELQYALAMQRWQMQMAQHTAEKQALIMKAIGLLKQDKMRGFRIDIETDSTIQTEAAEDKQSRIEFIKATTGFVEQAFQIGIQNPDAAPMLAKLLLFGVRGFRAGRDLESAIEEFADKMQADAAAKKGMPPPPNPEMQAKQIELQMKQLELQMAGDKSQAEVQKAQTDAASSAADNQREMATKQLDAHTASAQSAMQMEEMRQKAEYEAQSNAMKLREMQLKIAAMEQEHSHTMAQTNAAHVQMTQEHAQTLERMNAEHKHKMSQFKASKAAA